MADDRNIGFALILASSLAVAFAGCGEDEDPTNNGSGGADGSGGANGSGSAGGESSDDSWPTCERLFGLVTDSTGLTESQCQPVCESCGEDAQPRFSAEYAGEHVEWLRSLEDTAPPFVSDDNPYDTPEDHPGDAGAFCVLVRDSDVSYHTQTVETRSEAEAIGHVTHEGACGTCSSLQDLAVYIEKPDLTDPVRNCSVQNLGKPVEEIAACIAQLGFSEPCAQTWAYNSINTGELCRGVCLSLFDAPLHEPDGSLNECIQCDEDESGPVFKAVAGRTRRNSGLPTGLCRPCESVARLDHHYDW